MITLRSDFEATKTYVHYSSLQNVFVKPRRLYLKIIILCSSHEAQRELSQTSHGSSTIWMLKNLSGKNILKRFDRGKESFLKTVRWLVSTPPGFVWSSFSRNSCGLSHPFGKVIGRSSGVWWWTRGLSWARRRSVGWSPGSVGRFSPCRGSCGSWRTLQLRGRILLKQSSRWRIWRGVRARSLPVKKHNSVDKLIKVLFSLKILQCQQGSLALCKGLNCV